jgi:glycosyltransferase involved in cell wall biosynthesis
LINTINNLCLFVAPSSSLGGAERVLIENLKFLKKQKSLCPELLAIENGPLVECVHNLGIPVHLLVLNNSVLRIGDSPARNENKFIFLFTWIMAIPFVLWTVIRWRFFIKKHNPSVIHSNGFKTHLLLAWSVPRNIPIYWHLHDFIGDRPLMKRLLKSAWRPGIEALGISQAVAEDFCKLLPNCPTNIWYNSIDCDKFKPGSHNGNWLDLTAGLTEGFQGLRIGLVATYARWKGHEVFLESCSLLTLKYRDIIRFYIVGGPVYQTTGSQWSRCELEKTIHIKGLDGKVGLVPFQKDTSKVYKSLDIVIHASTRREPFGLVIGEAMACGKPVVAALHGGAAEIGRNGIDCIGHKPGCSDSLAAAIEELIQKKSKRDILGINARKRIIKNFGAENMLSNWNKIIMRLKNNDNHTS